MFSIEEIFGKHVWQLLELNGTSFCVPDLSWCASVLLFIIAVYFFIKQLFNVCRLFI